MWILDFLAPRSCVFCGEPGEGSEKSICTGCFADLPWNETPLKFRRHLFYAPALAEVLCVAKPLLAPDIDAVLPVPLHWRRKAMRGFNQATEIAKPIAKSLSVPLVSIVRRKRATPFQSGLDAVERARNLRRAFTIIRPASYTHILIVDDVVTTGATVQALATLLLSSGVTKVSVLAVARAG